MNASFPDPVVLTLDDREEMTFIRIEPGSFRMGSRGYYGFEEPIHRVHISEAFYLAETPVTQAQFAVWTRSAGIEHKNDFEENPDHPAESMSWNEARDYCTWLTGGCADQLPTGYEAGLPSEAQWEYACRGGAQWQLEYQGEYQGPSGGCDGAEALKSVGWFDKNSNRSTRPVKGKLPNPLGLYDMHGNVWEWCRDAFEADAYKWRVDGVTDPEERGPDDANRVMRGGSWINSARNCRSAYRSGGFPGYRDSVRGFRVGLFPDPSSQHASKQCGDRR